MMATGGVFMAGGSLSYISFLLEQINHYLVSVLSCTDRFPDYTGPISGSRVPGRVNA
jgi:hypothetical protein